MSIYFKIITVSLFVFFAAKVSAQENCFNGIDDDLDGLVDFNDSLDCFCVNYQSLTPNYNFEDHPNCCPNGTSQMHCVDYWQQATSGSSDYLNRCDFVPEILPDQFPSGAGASGILYHTGWQEWIGTTLDQKLLPQINYTIKVSISGDSYIWQFSDTCNMSGTGWECTPTKLVLYGASGTNNLPVDNSYYCPSTAPNWSVIHELEYNPTREWQVLSDTFSVSNEINQIIIGSPCNIPPEYPSLTCHCYFILDDIVLRPLGAINCADVLETIVINNVIAENNQQIEINHTPIFNSNTLIQLYDYRGRLISQKKLNYGDTKTHMFYQNIENSLYTIRILDDNTVYDTEKVVIIR